MNKTVKIPSWAKSEYPIATCPKSSSDINPFDPIPGVVVTTYLHEKYVDILVTNVIGVGQYCGEVLRRQTSEHASVIPSIGDTVQIDMSQIWHLDWPDIHM